ncbi:MAG: hypothetical protein AB7F96_05040 [Beijerinckiaceae bacterium]
MSERNETVKPHNQPGPAGSDRVARAIADGLMVLPPDDGVPPVLKRRGRSLATPVLPPVMRQQETKSQTIPPVTTAPSHPAPPQQAEVTAKGAPIIQPQVPPKPAGATVTPHPAVFRSRATPLAIHAEGALARQATAVPPPVSELEIPEAVIAPSEGHTEVAPDSAAEPQPHFVQPQERQVAPPSLHAVQSMYLDELTPDEPPAAPEAPKEPEQEAAPPPRNDPPPRAREEARQPQQPQQSFEPPQQRYSQPAAPPPPPPQSFEPPPPPHGYGYSPPSHQPYAAAYPYPGYMPMPVWQQAPMVMPQMGYPVAPPPPQQMGPQHALPGQQLMNGLLQYLPPPGAVWPAEERARWLEAASTLFDLAYGSLPGSTRR